MAASLFCVIITTLGLKQWADCLDKQSESFQNSHKKLHLLK